MRTLILLLVPSLMVACLPSDKAAHRDGNSTLFESIQSHQPAPRAPIQDSVAEALYRRVWAAVDPGDGFRDYRYLEFDWVMWNGMEVLRRSHRYSPWEGDFRVETDLHGQNLVAVGNWEASLPTRVWIDGEEIVGDSALFLATRAERMFELDANALLLPFRWAEPGVRAEHLGSVMMESGTSVESVELTFQGARPGSEPRFIFWVDPTTNLPTRSFSFRRESDQEPNSMTNWVDWRRFGPLMLSTRRTGEHSSEVRFENIRVESVLPPGRFRGPAH